MHHRGVAAMEPPVADHRVGRLWIVEVAGHHDVPARDDLAERFAVTRDVAALAIDDTQGAGCDQLDALAGLALRALRGRQRLILWTFFTDGDERRRLRQTVD